MGECVYWLLHRNNSSSIVILCSLPQKCLRSRCLEVGSMTPLSYCCVRVLLSNGGFCGSTDLAWSKYATLYLVSQCSCVDVLVYLFVFFVSWGVYSWWMKTMNTCFLLRIVCILGCKTSENISVSPDWWRSNSLSNNTTHGFWWNIVIQMC
jgi:hypothetical protein